MAIRLTKKRMDALHTALSLDDILYEKYRRLHEELNREYARLYRAKRIVTVVQRQNGLDWKLPILEVQTSPEGTRVIVG